MTEDIIMGLKRRIAQLEEPYRCPDCGYFKSTCECNDGMPKDEYVGKEDNELAGMTLLGQL